MAAKTLNDRLATYFRQHAGEWIDGLALSNIAGSYAWRSRVADLRKPRYGGMTIENRQVRKTRTDGSTFVISLYRYVPEQTAQEVA